MKRPAVTAPEETPLTLGVLIGRAKYEAQCHKAHDLIHMLDDPYVVESADLTQGSHLSLCLL